MTNNKKSIQVPPPKNIDEDFKKIYNESKVYQYDTVLPIHELHQVFSTRSGILLKKFKMLDISILDHILKYKKQYYRYAILQYFLRKKKSLNSNEKYILIHNHWSDGYHHWLCESLVRLICINPEICKSSILLLPESYKGFHLDSLKPFEFKDIFWIPLKKNLRVKNLITVPNPSSGKYNPTYIKKLQKKYLTDTNIIQNDLNVGDRVYISRRKAKTRKIANESEVLDLLTRKYNFSSICMEDYSFWEQVNIIKNTKTLVSIHGAGLSNMMFMDKNANILELYNKQDAAVWFNPCYWYLASITDLNYYYQFCNQSGINDIIVDLQKLEENLDLMLLK